MSGASPDLKSKPCPRGFPCGTSGKELAGQCRRDIRILGSIPGSGRSLREGHGNPLQYFSLKNPMDTGAWWAMVHRVAKSQTQLKWLSTHRVLSDTYDLIWTLRLGQPCESSEGTNERKWSWHLSTWLWPKRFFSLKWLLALPAHLSHPSWITPFSAHMLLPHILDKPIACDNLSLALD